MKRGRTSVKQQLRRLPDADVRIEYLKYVIGNHPGHLQAKMCLAQQYVVKKHFVAALEWAQKVMDECTPATDPTIVIDLATLYMEVWQAKRHRTHHRKSAICYTEERRQLAQRSLTLYNQLVAHPSIDPETRQQLVFKQAYAREQNGDAKGALQAYLAVVAAEYETVDLALVIFRAAVLMVYVGRFEEAIKYLEFLIDEPLQAYGYEPVHLYALLYHCYIATDLTGNARNILRKILATYVDAMRGNVAPEKIRQRLPLISSTSYLWESFAAQAIERCDYFLALAYLNRGTSFAANNVSLLVMLSESLAVLGLNNTCQTVATKAFQLQPHNSDIVGVLLSLDPVHWKAKLYTIPTSEPDHDDEKTTNECTSDTSYNKDESFLGKPKVMEEIDLPVRKYRWGESRLRKKAQPWQPPRPRRSFLPSISGDIRAKLQQAMDVVSRSSLDSEK